MRGFRKANNNNDILSSYLRDHPEAKWKKGFKDDAPQEDLDSIYNEIYTDQRGVCAYCEIAMRCPSDEFTDDFRIDHFHPENCGDDNSHNYSLDWNNLLGCCHGGTQQTSRSYGNSSFGKKHHSCDAPKGNKILDGVIFNPLLDLGVDQTFFKFDEDGGIFVSENCPANIEGKAQSTINELNLDCGRLRGFRKAVIEKLSEEIRGGIVDVEDSDALEMVILKLRNELLNAEIKIEFYSTIDWYLAV
ncbi:MULTISPECIES: retron Ec78 anti-phage system effector HNH endonuclease PtuB [unclassified Serratia (in: enterobacteria)]|uniref:retron Ec78 anti-phage system effector HNH endonuclease PtuB n=1 Tax=unclassified Serratia (in: enterobacteria) TaxID=2647522 RepID=UPI0015F660F1|nr:MULTISPECIES: retron Ec78 anti-phage system effector HNH endonuclease PtuB [unclassified Serratia (in: enterobacteria)]